jgi:hypothetical protein
MYVNFHLESANNGLQVIRGRQEIGVKAGLCSGAFEIGAGRRVCYWTAGHLSLLWSVVHASRTVLEHAHMGGSIVRISLNSWNVNMIECGRFYLHDAANAWKNVFGTWILSLKSTETTKLRDTEKNRKHRIKHRKIKERWKESKKNEVLHNFK